MRRLVVASMCLAAACSNGGSPAPAGWSPQGQAQNAWIDPRDPHQTYRVTSRSAANLNTLSDLSSTVAADVILRNKRARYLATDAFAQCPGAAGLQHFTAGAQRIDVAFSFVNGEAVEAEYRGPRTTPLPAAVSAAMAHAVCKV